MLAPCTSAVSLLRALIPGTQGACVEIAPASLVPLLVVFLIGVFILRRLARKMVAALFGRDPIEDESPRRPPGRASLKGPQYDSGANRSVGR